MQEKTNEIINDAEVKAKAGKYLASVYVIHSDGFVLLSREYSEGCISSDPQLIGGFLSAINSFVINASLDRTCDWDPNGKHRLVDIGMTCSRWFIKSTQEYTVAMLLSNDSPLVQQEAWETIDEIAAKIVDSFEVFRLFSSSEGTVDLFLDHSDEFGKTLDSILFEVIAELSKNGVEYAQGRKIDLNERLQRGIIK